MQCGKCGTHLGDMQVHDEFICRQQRKINEENRRGNSVIVFPCLWCGLKFAHEPKCPNG